MFERIFESKWLKRWLLRAYREQNPQRKPWGLLQIERWS